jgi:ubiquitin-like protein Pup
MVLPMAERTKKQRSTTRQDSAKATESQDAGNEAGADTRGTDRLKEELDGLLDEIDEVLETNAEDFVKSYVQKGGE